jgi:NTE family protein
VRPSITSATPPRVGLALGAGGIKGWAHVGVLKVLHKAGVPVDLMAGASAGALIGPLYAARRDPAEMERTALQFSLADYVDWFLRGLSLGPSVGTIASELWRTYGRLTFAELAVPFAVVAHDVATGARLVLDDGRVSTAVEASIRPPFWGRPVAFRDHRLIDGGLQMPVPADVVRDMGADIIIAVNVGAFLRLPRPFRPHAAALAAALDRHPTDPAGLRRQISFLCRLLSRQRLKPPDAELEIRPNMRGISAFAPWQAREAARRGELAARRALPTIDRALSAGALRFSR